MPYSQSCHHYFFSPSPSPVPQCTNFILKGIQMSFFSFPVSLTLPFSNCFFPNNILPFFIFIFTSIFFLIVCLANLSTLSLPKMPTWAGVQISWISLHFSFTLVHVVNFSSNRSGRLLDIPVLRLYSADNESLPIKTSLILSYFLIHSNAIVIAYNSTVYTFRSSVVLLLSSPPWLTIKIADPVLPCSGSFYPSA